MTFLPGLAPFTLNRGRSAPACRRWIPADAETQGDQPQPPLSQPHELTLNTLLHRPRHQLSPSSTAAEESGLDLVGAPRPETLGLPRGAIPRGQGSARILHLLAKNLSFLRTHQWWRFVPFV